MRGGKSPARRQIELGMKALQAWAVIQVLAGVTLAGVATAAPWTVTFVPPAAPTPGDLDISYSHPFELLPAPGGGAYLIHGQLLPGDLGGGPVQPSVIRLDDGGQVQWSRMLGNAGYGVYFGATVASDGAIFVADGTRLTRLESDGSTSWSTSAVGMRPVIDATGNLQAIAASGIVTTGGIAQLDAVTGVMKRWQAFAPTAGGACRLNELKRIAANDLLVSGRCTDTGDFLWRLDGDTLAVRWSRSGEILAAVATPAGESLYIVTRGASYPERNIERIDPQTGVTLWLQATARSPGPPGLSFGTGLFVDAAGQPIVAGVDRVDALDAADGSLRWSRPLPGPGSSATLSGSTLYLVGTTEDSNRAVVTRLDAASGAKLGEDLLSAGYGIASRVAAQASSALVAGLLCPEDAACTLNAWPLGASGAPGVPVTVSIPQYSYGTTAHVEGARAFAVALEWSATAGEYLRARMLRDADGAVLWERTWPSPFTTWVTSSTVRAYPAANGDVVVLAGKPVSMYVYNWMDLGQWAVWMINGNTGDVRWSHATSYAGDTKRSLPDIVVDGVGNVFVGQSSQGFYATYFDPQIARSIDKLDHLTGAVLWHKDLCAEGFNCWSSGAPNIDAWSGDLALWEQVGGVSKGITLLDGADGHVQWANANLPADSWIVDGPSVDHYLTTYPSSGQPITVMRLASDGQPRWTQSLTQDGYRFTMLGSNADPASGDVLVAGYRRSIGVSWYEGYAARLDAADGHVVWQRGDAAESVLWRSGFGFGMPRSDGFVMQRRTRVTGDRWFGRLRWSDGAMVDYQLDWAAGLPTPVSAEMPGVLSMGFGNDGLLEGIVTSGIVGEPLSLRVSMRETYETAPLGDLAVQLTAASGVLAPGGSKLVTLTADVTGPNPTVPVWAMLDLPLGLSALPVSCSVGGAPCQVRVMPQGLAVQVPLVAGGPLVVQASVRATALASESTTLGARVLAPYGSYREADINNNYAEATLVTSLFANGFE